MITHLHTLSGHQNPIYALANAAEENAFYSAGNDKGVVEWSLTSMGFVKVLAPVQSSVYALHRHSNFLFIAQRSGVILVFDLLLEKTIAMLNHHQKGVFDIKTIGHKNELLSTGEDGTVAVWSLKDLSLLYHFQVIQNTVRVIAISNDEKEVALGCKDGMIRIYNSEDYGLITELEAHTLPITSLQYDPTSTYLISGSRDAQLKVWHLPDYSPGPAIPAHMFGIYSIAFHPSAPFFATCSQDKSIKLWDSKNFKLYKILSLEKNTPGHFHSINKLIWSNDGRYLISTGDDRQVMVWEFNP
ncbi:WD40 repeat domain-containing protein [Pedobacter heparinus]|uniref:WD-40 repeat protein n=1 Tax=Pedobacter heparinus (strain ATCC 13125 / DSM 2366 / CIP 104194 / JCM 7457 / NBRC 12017 / NCIMB 9290 / NRRL B-14731 / HIM 762-3) TaxID=485917 RepID=C6Y3G9_PEDHD|nr:WD40 repeat domain-containing protein [Pedobacter heparinus]ACU05394.1 WD-40 repeat protein [Pedobacter heparinus DSM 2366]